MAVAFSATSEATGATATVSHTHTPAGGSPAHGVWVFISHGTVSTDIITGVTYGGDALTRVRTEVDAAGEPGRAYAYFLGKGLLKGAQSIAVSKSDATTIIHVVAVSITADYDTEVVSHNGTSGDLANPSVALTYGGRTCLGLVGTYSGVAAPGNLTELAGQTLLHDHDFGAFVSKASRQTTPGSSNISMGYTAAADDVALVACAISEIVPAGVEFNRSSSTSSAANPTTHSHAPGGTAPAAAIVFINHGTTANDIVSGVTYGGVAMTRLHTCFDNAGGVSEPGRAYCYVLLSGVPSGTQTVSVARTEATTVIHSVCATLHSSGAALEVVDSDTLDGNTANQADPSIPLSYGGRRCLALMGHYNGANFPGNLAEMAGQLLMEEFDFTDNVSKCSRQATPGTSDFTIGHTVVSNPFAMIALALSPQAGVTVEPGLGEATWTGHAPTIGTPITVSPDVGQATWTGHVPTIGTPITVTPGLGQALWEGYEPTISTEAPGTTVSPGLGEALWEGHAPTIGLPLTLTPGLGEAVWTGHEPTIGTPVTVATDTGQALWEGYEPTVTTVSQAVTIEPGTGVATWEGHAPTIGAAEVPDPWFWDTGGITWQPRPLEQPVVPRKPKKHRHPLRIPRALRPIPEVPPTFTPPPVLEPAPAIEPPAQPGEPLSVTEPQAPELAPPQPVDVHWSAYANQPYTRADEVEELELMLAIVRSLS